MDRQNPATGAAAVPWRHNALRHSFISYRAADVKNVAEVALEAGNSPDIIFQHYRELVTGERAKEWFGITQAVIEAESKGLKEEAAINALKLLLRDGRSVLPFEQFAPRCMSEGFANVRFVLMLAGVMVFGRPVGDKRGCGIETY